MNEEQLLKYIPLIGASSFGAVVGWLAHNVFQKAELLNVSWFASMIGVIGGGAVTAIFPQGSLMFGTYCIGLFISFFTRVIILPIIKAINEEKARDEQKKIRRQEAEQAKKQAMENKGTVQS